MWGFFAFIHFQNLPSCLLQKITYPFNVKKNEWDVLWANFLLSSLPSRTGSWRRTVSDRLLRATGLWAVQRRGDAEGGRAQFCLSDLSPTSWQALMSHLAKRLPQNLGNWHSLHISRSGRFKGHQHQNLGSLESEAVHRGLWLEKLKGSLPTPRYQYPCAE